MVKYDTPHLEYVKYSIKYIHIYCLIYIYICTYYIRLIPLLTMYSMAKVSHMFSMIAVNILETIGVMITSLTILRGHVQICGLLRTRHATLPCWLGCCGSKPWQCEALEDILGTCCREASNMVFYRKLFRELWGGVIFFVRRLSS